MLPGFGKPLRLDDELINYVGESFGPVYSQCIHYIDIQSIHIVTANAEYTMGFTCGKDV